MFAIRALEQRITQKQNENKRWNAEPAGSKVLSAWISVVTGNCTRALLCSLQTS